MTTRLRLFVALCGLLLAAPAVPGAAVEPAPTVDVDGGRWSAAVDRGLWDADLRWVPGDVRSVDVGLRNDSGRRVGYDVHVRVDGSGRDDALRRALVVRLEVDGVGQELRPESGTVRLPTSEPGARRRLRITAALPATASDATQGRRVAVRLQITPFVPTDREGGR